MLLAINANNTSTKFALASDGKIVARWRCNTEWRRTADEYFVFLQVLLAGRGLTCAGLSGIAIASVVPHVLSNLRALATSLGIVPVVIGDRDVDCGVILDVERPETIGADRIANAAGARLGYPGRAVVVVDFGTATTFDVISAAGSYCGGLIAPGVNLNLEALHMMTAALPRIVLESSPGRVVGRNTLEAMQAGAFWGHLGAVEGIVARIRGEVGQDMVTIATGGFADLFTGATAAIDVHDPDITMSGLVAIWERHLHDPERKAGPA